MENHGVHKKLVHRCTTTNIPMCNGTGPPCQISPLSEQRVAPAGRKKNIFGPLSRRSTGRHARRACNKQSHNNFLQSTNDNTSPSITEARQWNLDRAENVWYITYIAFYPIQWRHIRYRLQLVYSECRPAARSHWTSAATAGVLWRCRNQQPCMRKSHAQRPKHFWISAIYCPVCSTSVTSKTIKITT